MSKNCWIFILITVVRSRSTPGVYGQIASLMSGIFIQAETAVHRSSCRVGLDDFERLQNIWRIGATTEIELPGSAVEDERCSVEKGVTKGFRDQAWALLSVTSHHGAQ